jgi:hypothetical protein
LQSWARLPTLRTAQGVAKELIDTAKVAAVDLLIKAEETAEKV